ncbi:MULTISPECIES: hypothetical protein [unclassified Prochlorococcus]|uniref:hypothetical protein n=1 Tax=unclassified Prochlorococcus TaxID=2627481 RepID=UPI00053383EF|nr:MULTISPECIES: hypothetical protein [unclassified Prochlorococcus]KGG29069.1 hypothetical protein EV12_0333 [Prochlorococcus sp. MIT 0701]KGG29904.1 hypothetical protein EV13_0708 [Prochlorococcus sp. MIT 0702]KGG34136.1 hypothetical protein EV14_1483 [Prochlorococcus sp. MIT 0703]
MTSLLSFLFSGPSNAQAQSPQAVDIKINGDKGNTYFFRQANVVCEDKVSAYQFPASTWCEVNGFSENLAGQRKPYTGWKLCAITSRYLAPPEYSNVNSVTCTAARKAGKLPELIE